MTPAPRRARRKDPRPGRRRGPRFTCSAERHSSASGSGTLTARRCCCGLSGIDGWSASACHLTAPCGFHDDGSSAWPTTPNVMRSCTAAQSDPTRAAGDAGAYPARSNLGSGAGAAASPTPPSHRHHRRLPLIETDAISRYPRPGPAGTFSPGRSRSSPRPGRATPAAANGGQVPRRWWPNALALAALVARSAGGERCADAGARSSAWFAEGRVAKTASRHRMSGRARDNRCPLRPPARALAPARGTHDGDTPALTNP